MKPLNTIRKTCALLVAAIAPAVAMPVQAEQRFFHVNEGYQLDIQAAMDEWGEGFDTEAVKHFLETGENLYNEDPEFFDVAEETFNGMCSGCHGHYAEGKIGPGLNDSYWTYPQNEEDVGLFATIFGGARGQMGPMWGALTLDEMLLSMAWVRHLYTGDPAEAYWLTKEQRANFKPFDPNKRSGDPEDAEGDANGKADSGDDKAVEDKG